MRNLKNLLGALLCIFAFTAFAADLDSAKADGVIGEREDGYIGFVQASPPADVVALVEDINAKRRAEYERIAAQNGITRAEVEVLAGRKALARTASGGYIYTGGRWTTK